MYKKTLFNDQTTFIYIICVLLDNCWKISQYLTSCLCLKFVEDFEHFDCILRNILILAIAEIDVHDNTNDETPIETSRILLGDLILGTENTDSSTGVNYKGI